MGAILHRVLRRGAAAWHRVVGVLWLRLGRSERARTHFEQVLCLVGDDFAAHVQLGRIAFSIGDYGTWRRSLERARLLAPHRWARVSRAFELVEPRSAGTLADLDRQPRPQRCRPVVADDGAGLESTGSSVAGPMQANLPALPNGCRRDDCGETTRRYGDDFATDAERERFRCRTAIRSDEIQTCDLDELARQLARQ